MKKYCLILLLLFAGATGLYLFLKIPKNPTTTVSKETPSTISSAKESSAQSNNLSDDSIVLPSATHSALPNQIKLADRAGTIPPASTVSENIPSAIVLENVSRAIRQYGAMFGGNPVGTNPEITAALNGNNPKQINFIQPDAGMRIDEKGALVDPWGTPLFFHQLSGAETEIRSAGPDQIMWTPDDIIAK